MKRLQNKFKAKKPQKCNACGIMGHNSSSKICKFFVKRKLTCGFCGLEGHRKDTCTANRPPLSQEDFEAMAEIIEKKKPKKKKIMMGCMIIYTLI